MENCRRYFRLERVFSLCQIVFVIISIFSAAEDLLSHKLPFIEQFRLFLFILFCAFFIFSAVFVHSPTWNDKIKLRTKL